MLEDFVDNFYNDDAVYVPDDWLEENEFHEEEVVAILANYGQVRKYLADKAKARGFFSVRPPGKGKGRGRGKSPAKGKGKGKGKHARP